MIEFNNIIQTIGEAYGFDFRKPNESLRLEKEKALDLVVSKSSKNRISIGRFRPYREKLIATTEVTFYLLWDEYQIYLGPLTYYNQETDTYKEFAKEEGSGLEITDKQVYLEVCSICNEWGKQLDSEQWHDRNCPHPEVLLESSTFTAKLPQGLMVWVYRNSESDSTSGGISSKFDRLILCSTNLPQQMTATEELPAVVLKRIYLNARQQYYYCQPYQQPQGKKGGNFVHCNDSRLRKRCLYPVPVHDRFE